MKPLCIDLFCGLGGWAEGFIAEGYDVVGFDIDQRFGESYEATGGHFVCADVRDLDGLDFQAARCIVASPPCQEFSDLRFLRPNPKEPDIALVEASWRIRKESGRPMVLENVRGARRFIGQSVVNRGPWYLWGDVPLLFDGHLKPKVGAVARARRPDGSLTPSRLRQWGARDRSQMGAAKRAKIPLPLARAVARGFL